MEIGTSSPSPSSSNSDKILGKRKSEDEIEQTNDKKFKPENNKTKLHFLFVSTNRGKQIDVNSVLKKLGVQVSFHVPQIYKPHEIRDDIEEEDHVKAVKDKMELVMDYLTKTKTTLDECKKRGVTHILIEDSGLQFEWNDCKHHHYVKTKLDTGIDNEEHSDIWIIETPKNRQRGFCIFVANSIDNFSKENFYHQQEITEGEFLNGLGWDLVFFHKESNKTLCKTTLDENINLGFSRKPLERLVECLQKTSQ